MPKAEKGTPKDIANRMKAKGLQKLKFYCQMCAKQCRDENGFKCHMTSDSHLRQMKIFRENAGGMMDSFSREFEVGYLETLRRRHGTQRMNANNVYQEVIQDKHHVHMNSTKWATLSDFVQYLGRKGVCVVEETERGWYVTYIERDPALLARKEKLARKTEADRREERLAAERREALRAEAARALDRAGCAVERKASEIGPRGEDDGVVKMEMKLGTGKSASSSTAAAGKKRQRSKGKLSSLEEEDDEEEEDKEKGEGGDARDAKQSGGNGTIHRAEYDSTLKRDMKRRRPGDRPSELPKRESRQQHDEKTKEEMNHRRNDKRKDHWLRRDIIVRIISKKLADGEYYKRKAVVDRVISKYEAEVEILDSGRGARDGGDVLRIDQDDLETVVPREEGGRVRIVNGRHRGERARVERLDKRECRADLRLADDGGTVTLDYEDFSKMA